MPDFVLESYPQPDRPLSLELVRQLLAWIYLARAQTEAFWPIEMRLLKFEA
jgi:hypothetical protein